MFTIKRLRFCLVSRHLVTSKDTWYLNMTTLTFLCDNLVNFQETDLEQCTQRLEDLDEQVWERLVTQYLLLHN